ncbi:hypothetical protein ABZ892_05920 [Streptomyces sp. NPDC046924]|uniref:hypothetical protein n=1 Tax=Streptomyces sp. NPDC046924 TaxID=3155136 RepID=UPI00340E14A4
MAEPAETAVSVLMLVVATGCTWLGWTSLRRPREAPASVRGPGWLVRTWGLGYLVLGVGLFTQEASRAGGEDPFWSLVLIRWIAGPLLVFSLMAGAVRRWRERRAGRVASEGRRA